MIHRNCRAFKHVGAASLHRPGLSTRERSLAIFLRRDAAALVKPFGEMRGLLESEPIADFFIDCRVASRLAHSRFLAQALQ